LLPAAAIAILTGLLTSAGPAAAAFPGANGKIAFDNGFDILTMNPDGSGKNQLTSSGDAADASWSPDGNRIAFGGIYSVGVWVMKADGSSQIELTTSSARYLSWSPDGKRIVYSAFGGGISVINADGTDETQLTTAAGDEHPSWSPDGTQIAYVSGAQSKDGGEIFVMNANGSDPTQLTNSGGQDAEPDWSPDGTKIAFTDYPGTSGGIDRDLWVMNADGSDQTQLSNGTHDFLPAWSPDGTKIAFTRLTTLDREIWTMNADGSDQTKLASGGVSAPSWQPLTSSTGSTADLLLRMAGPRRIGPGDPITYVIRVRNRGPAEAEDVVVSDPLPAGTSFVRALSPHGACTPPDPASGAALSCSLGAMGDGSTRTIILVCRAPSTETTLANTTTVSTGTPDPDLHDNSAAVRTQVR
jgi:uncharacterized repeat protein (TIGR01451 family)